VGKHSSTYRDPDAVPDGLTDTEAALAAGTALGAPHAPGTEDGTGAYAVVPTGYELKSLEEFLPHPLRVKEAVQLHETESFIEYVNEYRRPGTHIFFCQETERFVAVLDFHENPATPNWCDHVSSYQPTRSPEFKTWSAYDRKTMTQVDFARFLEENMPDIVEPASAHMLEVALTFEAKKSVEFSSGVRLPSGQIQFEYNEVIRGTSQKGAMEVPEKFFLGIPIHVNEPNWRFEARLRWRLQEGKVVFWYELVRPHRQVEQALKEIRERIASKTTVPVLAGATK
jgi:uncharacterized protein YfdQ (DUF2303 family)